MVGFFIWLLQPRSSGWKTNRGLRTLYAFAFLLITLIGLQVLTGGHRTARMKGRAARGGNRRRAAMRRQVVYCSHQTTTLALRERLAFATGEQLNRAYQSLKPVFRSRSTSSSRPAIASKFTQPRMNPAQSSGDQTPTRVQVADFLSRFHGVPRDDLCDTLLAEGTRGRAAFVRGRLERRQHGFGRASDRQSGQGRRYRIAQDNGACGR